MDIINKKKPTLIDRLFAGLTVFALVITLMPTAPVAYADHDPFGGVPQTSVALCHSGSGKNFVTNSPSITATGGNINLAGHEGHAHDIIPPFHYDNGGTLLSYPGKNWETGEATWRNGCVDPTANQASVKVTKLVQGGDATADDFTLYVSDGVDDIVVESGVARNFVAGKKKGQKIPYTVYEGTMPSDYELTAIQCMRMRNDDTAPILGNIQTGQVTIDLINDESYDCTITNTYVAPPDICEDETAANYNEEGACYYEGTLIVKKVIEGGEGVYGDFYFTVDDGAQTQFDTDGLNEFTLLTGTSHTVVEISPAGYDVSYDSCEDVVIPKNDSVTCTITNTVQTTDDTTITITKQTLPDGDQAEFSFELNDVALTSGALSDGESSGAIVVQAGSHKIEELVPGGWTLADAVCYNENQVKVGSLSDDGAYTMTLAEGDDVTCTFTNTKDQEPPKYCTVEVVSDTQTTVVEKSGASALLLSYIHPAWTAVITGASWIWGDNPVVNPSVDETQTFTRSFEWNGPVVSATLEIASDNSHTFDLNGTTDGDASENNHALATQDSYDVASAISTGINDLEIAVKNWAGNSNPRSNPAGLMYKLTVTGTDPDCALPPAGRYTLDITITGDGFGTVTTDDQGQDIMCYTEEGEGQDCEETYPAGTEVTLIATPDEGSNFDASWTVGAGSCTGATTPCTVTMNSNVSLTAHFALNAPSRSGGGGGGRLLTSSTSGGSDDDDRDTPPGDVEGASDSREQVTVVPTVAGAATGAGGSQAPLSSTIPLMAMVAMIASLAVIRRTANEL